MHIRHTSTFALPRRRLAACGAATLALLAAAQLACAGDRSALVTVAARNDQPAGAGIELAVGLTPNGDGSTCGTSVSVQVEVGDIVDVCYVVTNTSGTDLAYSTLVDDVDGRVLNFAPTSIPAGGRYVYHRRVRARTSSVHRATWTAQDRLHSYAWDDARPLDFVDVSATGTPFDMDAWGAEREVDLPFAFAAFGGGPVTRLCVSNQGFIRTEVTGCRSQLGSIAENGSLPLAGSGTVPFSDGNVILPYWDMLDNVQGNVYWAVQGEAPNRRLVVQWDRAHVIFTGPTYDPAGTQGRIEFEAILGEDGSIAFQYRKTTFDYVDWIGNPDDEYDDGRSATIGLSAARTNGGSASQYSFDATMPHPAPSSIHWTARPPTAVYTAEASTEIDVGGPLIAPSPALVAAAAPSGSTAPVAATLSIGNAGDRTLDWSVAEGAAPAAYRPPPSRRAVIADDAADSRRRIAQARPRVAMQQDPSRPTPPGASAAAPPAPDGAECGPSVPGVVIHDDGVATNGYAGLTNAESVAVDKFTPTYYPATFTTVCVAFSTYFYPVSPTGRVDYEVVVYDDTGPGGAPGNELGAIAATTTGAAYPDPAVFRDRVDVSALGIALTSGSVYIGVRWNPDQSPDYTAYLSVDDDGTDGLPPNPPEGGYFDFGDGVFRPIASLESFADYKSLMVRAVETAPGCTRLEDVPWLALSATSGSVPAGGTPSTLGLTLDPAGLADGVYTANLCVASGYETVAVPVQFTIGTAIPLANLTAPALDFSLPPDGIDGGVLTLTNAGTPNSLLNYSIGETAGDCAAPSDVPWLRVQPAGGTVRVGSPASIRVDVDAHGLGGGAHSANLCIATNDAAHPLLGVPVALNVVMPDAVFADGFESAPNPPAIYATREAFLSHVRPGYYAEGFDDVVSGVVIVDPLQFSSETFAYTIQTEDGAASGFYNFPGVISHNDSDDRIVVTFYTPVTAVGGNFWESNAYGEESGGPIWLTLSDGTFLPMGATSQATSFEGFITAAPITSLTIESPNAGTWEKLDNLIVGYKN